MTISSIYRDKQGNPIRRLEWARLFEDFSYRRVADTHLPGDIWVSTVWLGIAIIGPRGVFESAVFRSTDGEKKGWPLDEQRYSTLEEAQAGHAELVAKWSSRCEAAPNEG